MYAFHNALELWGCRNHADAGPTGGQVLAAVDLFYGSNALWGGDEERLSMRAALGLLQEGPFCVPAEKGCRVGEGAGAKEREQLWI